MTDIPELTAFQAAAKAITDFDAAHDGKKRAIIAIAEILERHGWSGVEFEEDFAGIPIGQRIRGDTDPISINALAGATVVEIVTRRRLLVKQHKAAYDALPDQLKSIVSRSGGRSPR